VYISNSTSTVPLKHVSGKLSAPLNEEREASISGVASHSASSHVEEKAMEGLEEVVVSRWKARLGSDPRLRAIR